MDCLLHQLFHLLFQLLLCFYNVFFLHFLCEQFLRTVWTHQGHTCEMVAVGKTPTLANLLHQTHILQEHSFPEGCIILPELVRNLQTQTKVQNDNLMLLRVLWIWPDEYIAWMRITMYEPCHKYLLCKPSYNISDYCLLIKFQFP